MRLRHYTYCVYRRIRKSAIRRGIAYGIFHLPNSESTQRNQIVRSLREKLKGTWSEIPIRTIAFKNLEEITNFEETNLGIDFLPEGYEYNGETGWRLGELGIWAGNILAWKKFVNSRFDYLILFEDDVIFRDNFVDLVHQVILKAPKGWDVISLYSPDTEKHKFELKKAENKTVVPIFQDWSMLSYVVSVNGAKKLLKNIVEMGPISYPIDWFMWRNIPNLNIYAINPYCPQPFELAGLESTFQQSQERHQLDYFSE